MNVEVLIRLVLNKPTSGKTKVLLLCWLWSCGPHVLNANMHVLF